MKTKKLLALILIGLLVFAAGCAQAPLDENNEEPDSAQPEAGKVFEGKITSIDEESQTLTVDLTLPFRDTILLHYSDDTEFAENASQMLRMGAMIRFETNGASTKSIPAQMSALKITDSWVPFDSQEKIDAMLEGREAYVLERDRPGLELQKGETFLVKLTRKDALDTHWRYEVSDEGAFEYQDQIQFMEDGLVSSLYEMKAVKKGEHFLYFHEVDPKTYEDLVDVSFQLIVRDETNTEGNIVELTGKLASIKSETIVLRSEDGEHTLYAPNLLENFGDFKPGDQLIVGAEIGEASYKLVFARKLDSRKTETGLPVVGHVVKIENVSEDSIEVLWNEGLLSIYHNGLLADQDWTDAYVYVEYAVDKSNEANELLLLEPIRQQ